MLADSDNDLSKDAQARRLGFRVAAHCSPVAHDLRDALLAQEHLRGTPFEQEFRSPRPIYETSLWLLAAGVTWLVVLLCL